MRVFAVAGKTDHRFRFESDFETFGAENFFDDCAHKHFVIGSLHGVGESPIDFELFANVSKVTRLVNLSFETANFFVTHFDAETVFVQSHDTFFQRAANCAVSAFPVLFLQNLRRAHFFDGSFFKRSFYPKFKFGCGSKDNVDYVGAVHVKPVNFGLLAEQVKQFAFDESQRIGKD